MRKGLPIGAITWGAGSIGVSSISTLAKELRRLFTVGDSDEHHDWVIEDSLCTVHEGARRFRQFTFVESAKLCELEPKAYLRAAVHAALNGEQVSLPHELAVAA